MNHRELVLSARKKAKFYFLQLPEDLQDEIVEGLDAQSLTLETASALVKAKGYSLSHEAIAAYYRAVRRERRIYDMNGEVARLVGEFAQNPVEDNLASLVNILIGMAMKEAVDGNLEFKPVDIAKLAAAIQKPKQPGSEGQKVLTSEQKRQKVNEAIESVYGISL